MQRACDLFDRQRVDELRRMNRLDRLLPRVDVSVRRRLDLRVEPRAYSFAVFDQNGAQLFNPKAFDEIISALQILRVFAVILHEATHTEQRVVVRFDRHQQIAFAHLRSGGAADVDFPLAALDRHGADVLGRRLRAIARAPGRGEFDLVRELDALIPLLDGDAQRHAVADAEATELRSDAGLARAECLRVGVSRRHPQIAPDVRQVFLVHPQEIDALPARDLDHSYVVFLGDVGDAAQFVGRGHAAVYARHDAECAVLLDVRVDAVVDESRVALVFVFVAPDGFEQRGQPDFASRIILAARERREDRGDGFQLPLLNGRDQFGLGERNARNVVMN